MNPEEDLRKMDPAWMGKVLLTLVKALVTVERLALVDNRVIVNAVAGLGIVDRVDRGAVADFVSSVRCCSVSSNVAPLAVRCHSLGRKAGYESAEFILRDVEEALRGPSPTSKLEEDLREVQRYHEDATDTIKKLLEENALLRKERTEAWEALKSIPERLELARQLTHILMDNGNHTNGKIPAVKVVRHVTGLGLKEAKDFVETEFPVTKAAS